MNMHGNKHFLPNRSSFFFLPILLNCFFVTHPYVFFLLLLSLVFFLEVRASVGHMAGAFTSWARDSALGPAVLNEVLKTGVTYELQQVCGI